MPPKQNHILKEAFDSIVFLGFVALLSVAANKASTWEQEMCGPKSRNETAVTKAPIESKMVSSAGKIN